MSKLENVIRIISVMLFVVSMIIISSCDLFKEKVVKEETIAQTEVFIHGVGLDAQRAAFNSSGTHLITSGRNGTTIWDVQAKKELITLYDKEAHSSAISKSGRYLITFSPSDYGIIRICDLNTLTIHSLRIYPEENAGYGRYLSGITISDDEKYFALYSEKIKIFDLESLSQINEIPLKKSHYLFNYRKHGLHFIPDTHDLLTISYDISFSSPNELDDEGNLNLDQIDWYSVNIWDINSREPKTDIRFNSKFIFSWALSGDGNKLAFILINSELRILDLFNKAINNFSIQSGSEIDAISFKDDGNLLLANRQGMIGVYYPVDKRTEMLHTDIRRHFKAPSSVAESISPDGKKVAFCNGYNQVIIYDVLTNQSAVLSDEANSILAAYFDPDQSLRILTSSRKYFQSGAHFRVESKKVKKAGGNGLVLIEDPQSGRSELFNEDIGKTVSKYPIGDNEFFTSFSQDGNFGFLYKGDENPEGELYVINLNDRYSDPVRLQNSTEYYGFSNHVFDHQTKAVISGLAHVMLGVWDIKTGKLIRTLNEQSGNARAFKFLDETKCLIGTRGFVKLYDMNTGEVLKTYKPKGYQGDYRGIEKISFSPDGKHFATGDAWGLVTIWAFDQEHEKIFFETHKNGITSLNFSPDGKQIIVGSSFGKSAVVSDVSTGREIARFVSFSDGEWIVITPEGFFNASPNGAKYLNVRVGSQVYSIDNFHEKYFNPTYLASVLGGKSVQAVADIREGIAPPPVIKFISPQPNAEYRSENITVTISADDMGGGIEEIRLFHNGKVVSEETRGMKIASQRQEAAKTVSAAEVKKPQAAASRPDFTKSYSVILVDGINTFRAVGFSKDRTESNPVEITVQMTGGPRSVAMHIVTVGINKYANPALNLNYAEPDARGIANFFRQSGNGLFKEINIKDVYNEQATKENILSRLKHLQNTNPQDAVLIYLAGHGENIKDQWYFIPHELKYPEREEELKSKGISSDDLSDLIKNIQAQKILVLIDACKSGAALTAFRGFEDRKALAQLSRATGIHVVAASTRDQFASEVKELGHGVFTYTLLQGLKGKGAARGETITVRKLMGHIEEELPELTKKYRQEAQFPVVDSKGMDFPLVIK
jgi:WD40 repeat protein